MEAPTDAKADESTGQKRRSPSVEEIEPSKVATKKRRTKRRKRATSSKTPADHDVFTVDPDILILIEIDDINVMTMKVDTSVTIESIMIRIRSQSALVTENHKMFHLGKPLENGRTLDEQNIKDDAILKLKLMMKIVVENKNCDSVTLEVTGSDTVQSVIDRTPKEEGYSDHRHAILFGGNKLDTSLTLDDYDVQDNDPFEMYPEEKKTR